MIHIKKRQLNPEEWEIITTPITLKIINWVQFKDLAFKDIVDKSYSLHINTIPFQAWLSAMLYLAVSSFSLFLPSPSMTITYCPTISPDPTCPLPAKVWGKTGGAGRISYWMWKQSLGYIFNSHVNFYPTHILMTHNWALTQVACS